MNCYQLRQFLDECEWCVDACICEEAWLDFDNETHRIIYKGAPNLYNNVERMLTMFEILPLEGFSNKKAAALAESIKEMVQYISHAYCLKRDDLIELYLATLCLCMELGGVQLVRLETLYYKGKSGLKWAWCDLDESDMDNMINNIVGEVRSECNKINE